MSRRLLYPAMTREELLGALRAASRENSNTAVMLHAVIGEKMGLSAIEEKTLGFLEQHGPLTAGEIATRTGLAGASVTSLIDRLEKKGYAFRVRDAADRRKVLVELNREKLTAFDSLFGSLGPLLEELFAAYNDDQLAVLLDFMQRATSLSRQHIARLSARESAVASS